MDVLGISTAGAGLLVIVVLILVAAKRGNLAQVYQNVIYMTIMLSGLFTVIVGALRAASAGSIILPLTSLVGMGLIGIAGIHSERAKPFTGLFSPVNLSALAAFFVALSVIATGVVLGLDPFLRAQEAGALAVAAGIADGARGAAVNGLLLVLTPMFAAMFTVITKLATIDASGGESAA